MPGNEWQQRANLRLLYGYMYTLPGKKLLFMGAELGQRREWNHDTSLDWHLLGDAGHDGIRRWLADVNQAYREHPALHELDCDPAGFEWVHVHDSDAGVLAFARRSRAGQVALAVCNFTPVLRTHYRLGAPVPGRWREILNSDAEVYGGSGAGNLGAAETSPEPLHGREQSLTLTLPPLACIVLLNGGEA